MKGLLSRLLPVLSASSLVVGAVGLTAGGTGAATGASPSPNGADPKCSSTNMKGTDGGAMETMYSCDIWTRNIPLYADANDKNANGMPVQPMETITTNTSQGSQYQWPSRASNLYFFYQCTGAAHYLSDGLSDRSGYTNSNWARALYMPDKKTGFVPETNFRGPDQQDGQAALPRGTSLQMNGSSPSCPGMSPASSGASPQPNSNSALPGGITSALTLQQMQMVGPRVIYCYSGTDPTRTSLMRYISQGEAGGVILSGANFNGMSLDQIHSVMHKLDAARPAGSPPLLLMTDQEGANQQGGGVNRLPGAPTMSESQIGQSSNAQTLATQAGAGAGQTLTRAGLNVNLAPVLDVYRDSNDFIDQAQRSYSTDPNTVASLGSAFIVAQMQQHVAATAKHFPGLGAAEQNTDTATGPVTLNQSNLRTVDELPYQDAINDRVDMVMLSWATYPALDQSNPAGLSSNVINGELRGRLHFRGVTITDSLAAGAIGRYGTVAQRGALAAQAGADLVMYTPLTPNTCDPMDGFRITSALATALQSGKLSNNSEAVGRVNALRSQLPSA